MKIFLIVLSALITIQPAYADKDPYTSRHKSCQYQGIKECQLHGLDPLAVESKDAAGYCTTIGYAFKSCDVEMDLVYAYGIMAATCTGACLADAAGPLAAPLETACFFGSTAASLSEFVYSRWLSGNSEQYNSYLEQEHKETFGACYAAAEAGFSGMLAASNVGANFLTTMGGQGKDAVGKLGKSGFMSKIKTSCLMAAVNAGAVAIKTANIARIGQTAANNLASAQQLWPADTYANYQENAYMAPDVTASTTPPPIADVRTSGIEIPVANATQSLSRLAESFATAGDTGYYAKPKPQDLFNATKALGDALGTNPAGIYDTLEKGGPDALIEAASKLGSPDAKQAMSGVLASVKSKMNSSNLAFENTSGGGSNRKPSSDPLANLFGNKSGAQPMGSAGPKDIKFSGFNGDIWHAGSNLSIFEIVSKKTQDVGERITK